MSLWIKPCLWIFVPDTNMCQIANFLSMFQHKQDMFTTGFNVQSS